MKTMTCKQLGGACEKEFHANTFEEIGASSPFWNISIPCRLLISAIVKQ